MRIEEPELLRRLVEHHELPFATTTMAKGMIDEDHPLSIGCIERSCRQIQRDRQTFRELDESYGDKQGMRARDRAAAARATNNDWRAYRDRNRAVFAKGNWRAPFRYTQFRVGTRVSRPVIAQRYWILDPWRYRLPSGGKSRHWVRHYNDVLFVDTYRGVVLRVIPNFFV